MLKHPALSLSEAEATRKAQNLQGLSKPSEAEHKHRAQELLPETFCRKFFFSWTLQHLLSNGSSQVDGKRILKTTCLGGGGANMYDLFLFVEGRPNEADLMPCFPTGRAAPHEVAELHPGPNNHRSKRIDKGQMHIKSLTG